MNLTGVGSFIILVVDIYAISMIARRTGTVQRWIWGLLVLFLSLTGVAIWYFVGHGDKAV